AEAMAFVGLTTDPEPENAGAAEALRNALFFFLEQNSPAALQLGKVFGEADPAEARAAVLESELKPWLRRQKLERLVVQQLATALSLETADCDLLLRAYKQDETSALESLTADAFFAADSFD